HRVRGRVVADVQGVPARPPDAGQVGAVRVRHRPHARACRAVPGALLPGGDDLHHLRHRDHLPLPVGGDLRARPAPVRADGDARLRHLRVRVVRVSDQPGRARLGPGQAPAAAHHRHLRAHVRLDGAPGGPGGRGRLMGLERFNHNFLTGNLETLVKWAQRNSVMPATFGLACCAIEMMATGAANFDLARFGMEVFRASPRQADLMIVAGRVSQKMAPVLRQVYDQMMEPKWVISMGVCASSGGMFNNYAIVQGVDQVVPVDVYVPGCPPNPETLLYGILTLHALIERGELTRRRDATGGGAGVHIEQLDGQTSGAAPVSIGKY